MPKRRILVVEDEKAIARLIEMNLRLAGMECTVFHDGDAAAESLEAEHSYSAALLDIMLPGCDGFALLHRLKGYSVPVIFLTAVDDVNEKVRAFTEGAEDYVVKPFEMLELLARIDKVISRSCPEPELLCVGDVTVDTSRRSVTRGGCEVKLKNMEFELLCVLIRNKNIAISREELLAAVWGVNYLGESRTVDVHIGQLRRKLGLHDAIKTVPKIGYRLEDVT